MTSFFSRVTYVALRGTFRRAAATARQRTVGALGVLPALLLGPAILLGALLVTRRGRRRLGRAGGVAALAAAGACALAEVLMGTATVETPPERPCR
jgi:hypothetical protein